jgi:hypothetical protein
MATLTVGGKTYQVPEMNFFAVERAWPFVQEATAAFDPIKGSAAAIAVIAAAMFEAEDFDRAEWGIDADAVDGEAFHLLVKAIKRKMKANEIGAAKDTMFEILKEGGMDISEGEILQSLGLIVAGQGEEGDLSPETAADTSPSSSPQE